MNRGAEEPAKKASAAIGLHPGWRETTRGVSEVAFPVAAMGRVLEVSTSGFYGWRVRE